MNSKKIIEIGIFSLILLSIIYLRYNILFNFGFEYCDSDQAIMWNALSNYSEGEFYEPRFYGQAYNTMLEALFAVPFYKLGLPAFKATPLITTILSLFPYFLISFLAFKKKSVYTSLVILSLPLLLPIEYHLITTIPRGFVTGIFISSFCTLPLFYLQKRQAFLMAGICSIVAYSVNANSVLISIPCILYVFLYNIKNIHFYIYSSIGLLVGIGIHLWINYFYIANPFYNLHKYDLDYSFKLLVSSLSNLDDFFNYVSPIFWNQGFIWLLLFIFFGLYFLKKKQLKFGSFLLIIPLLVVLTLGITKVHDGNDSIFFSLSRMYLSLPILIAISISLLKNKKSMYLYFTLPLVAFTYNIQHLDTSINKNVSNNKNHVVSVAKVKSVINECENLNTLCILHKIDLVVIVNHYYYDFINYGCTVCSIDFPKTLRPSYERRTWRLLEDENFVYKNILFIDTKNQLDSTFDYVEQLEDHKDKFIIKNNTLKTIELLNKMNIDVRKYK